MDVADHVGLYDLCESGVEFGGGGGSGCVVRVVVWKGMGVEEDAHGAYGTVGIEEGEECAVCY